MTHKVITLWAGVKITEDGEQFIGILTEAGPLPMVSSDERHVPMFEGILEQVAADEHVITELRKFTVVETMKTWGKQ